MHQCQIRINVKIRNKNKSKYWSNVVYFCIKISTIFNVNVLLNMIA